MMKTTAIFIEKSNYRVSFNQIEMLQYKCRTTTWEKCGIITFLCDSGGQLGSYCGLTSNTRLNTQPMFERKKGIISDEGKWEGGRSKNHGVDKGPLLI